MNDEDDRRGEHPEERQAKGTAEDEVEQEDADAGLTELQSFLSHAALEAGETQGESWDDCVQLMTMHSAKGLEFPWVMILKRELIPSKYATRDWEKRQEENLLYVAITRSSDTLVIHRGDAE